MTEESVPKQRPFRAIDLVVLLTVFSLPFGSYALAESVITVSVPNLLLPVSTLLIVLARRHQGLRVHEYHLLDLFVIILILCWGTAAFVANAQPPRQVVTFVGYLLTYVVVGLYVDSYVRLHRVMVTAFAAAVAISVLTLFSSLLEIPIGQPLIGHRTVLGIRIPFERTLGVPLTYGAYGMYLLAPLPYVAVDWLWRERSWLLGGCLGIVLASVVVSQSRSTWLAAIVAISVLGFGIVILGREIPIGDHAYRFLAGVSALTAVSAASVVPKVLIRIDRGTYRSRVKQYSETLEWLIRRPLIGVGTDFSLLELPGESSPHNAFLINGLSMGLPVLAGFVVLFITTPIRLVRTILYSPSYRDQMIALSLLAGFSAVLVELQLLPQFSKAPWLILGAVAGFYARPDRTDQGLDRQTRLR
jgi:O-antigen ligase